MRFVRVTFRCFGPFEEHPLEFGVPGKLCVVFGPNEAGKSTALRGLQAFLFGFDNQSPDNFRFQHKQFRIHAVLTNGSGDEFECIRRKGHKDTLRKKCDKEVVPDHQLTSFLAGLDEQQFEQLFGLGADRLVKGGKAIAVGSGEVGGLLFEAGAGMKGLRQLSRKLEVRQQDLYLAGGKKQSITEALRRYRDQVDVERKLELLPEVFATAESVARQAVENVDHLVAARRDIRGQRDLLNRYQSALPTIDLLRVARDRFAQVADAPLLSVDFDVTLQHARKQLEAATLEIGHWESQRQSLNSQLEGCDPPTALLREEAEIEDLKKDISADIKLRKDEVQDATFSVDEKGKARDIFRTLTGSTDWEQMDALKPRDDERDRIQTLANERSAIELDVGREETAVRQSQSQLKETREKLGQSPHSEDPAPWQKLVDEIAPLGTIETQHEQRRKAVLTEELNLAAEFARMQPVPAISWQDALGHPVPLPEAIERFREDFDSAAAKMAQFGEQERQIQRELETFRSSFIDKVGSEPVPTVEELTAARGDRDGGLHGLRARLAGQPNDALEADFCNRYATGRPLIDAVENSVRQCDTLADRLRHEADRVAGYLTLKQQECVLQGRLTEIADALQSTRLTVKALEESWRNLWQPTGIAPDVPKVMRTWLANWSKLRDRVARWRDDTRQCEADQNRIESILAELTEGCPAAGGRKSIATALAAARAAIAEAQKARGNAQMLEDTLLRLEKQLKEARERLEIAKSRQRQWQEDWSTAISVIRLSGATSVETAQRYLASIARMQQHLTDMRIKDARVRGIRTERDRLLKRLNALRSRLDPSVQPCDAETMESHFRTLQSALDDAREKRTRYQQLVRQLKEIDAKLNAANSVLRESRATLEALAEEARVAVDELPTAVQRARERVEASQRVQEYEQALAKLAQGEPMPHFEASALGMRTDLSARLDELNRQVEQMDQDVSRAEAEARDRKRILDEYLAASGAAAEARQQAELYAAKVEEETKEFAALIVARAALDRAKDRYRVQHQDTMLARSGEFFRTLTNGAFSQVEIESEEGRDVLVVMRSSPNSADKRVTVDGLSDGTRDQLFLALRLAAIERHLGERGPMPLIVDDVLVNFDDDRSRATLGCLAQMANKTQVIVFTHHRHIVNLARSVDPETQVIDMGLSA